MKQQQTIIYTITDEAPALATYSFLPIVRAFAGTTGVNVETRDISLGGRILAQFPDVLGAVVRVRARDHKKRGRRGNGWEPDLRALLHHAVVDPLLLLAERQTLAGGFVAPTTV